MDYYFTGRAICNRCHKEYDWYCINLNLTRRSRGEPSNYSEPAGANMSFNNYFKNGVPEFQGYCPHCDRVATLPDNVASTIPTDFYTNR